MLEIDANRVNVVSREKHRGRFGQLAKAFGVNGPA